MKLKPDGVGGEGAARLATPTSSGECGVKRLMLAMSQTRLGELLDLTFQQIQKYEKGTNRISAGRLFDIARIQGVPIDYFFEGVGQSSVGSVKSAMSTYLISLCTDENLRLAIAFMSVTDPKTRKRIVEFVKSLAEEDAPEKRVARR